MNPAFIAMMASTMRRQLVYRQLPRVLCIAVWSALGRVAALDKQGNAHMGSASQSESSGTNISGALMLGSSLYNPSYAARPDNTGRALMRYAGHVDLDLWGPKLSVPLDINLFTDAERAALGVFAPTEFDIITGLTSTVPIGTGALELGARFEHDRPIDRSGFTQTYVDMRARYLYALSALWPELNRLWGGTEIGGWITLGWFAYNPTYAARPDNSGIALLRYAAHTELSVLSDLFSLGLDFTFFSDKNTHVLAPSELDWTADFIVHIAPWELHIAYERDMPVDRGGFVQSFVYALAVWSFDLKRGTPTHAVTDKNAPASP